MSAEPDYINHVIIGVGINVNQTEFPEEIAKQQLLFVSKWDRLCRGHL